MISIVPFLDFGKIEHSFTFTKLNLQIVNILSLPSNANPLVDLFDPLSNYF